MKIIIAGAGSVGTHLARLLSNEAFNIVLIDESESKLSKVNELDIMTLCVSPTSIKGLENAGVEHADLFIAVTRTKARISCAACWQSSLVQSGLSQELTTMNI